MATVKVRTKPQDDGLITLYKPDGTEVRVNENSLKYATKTLGWKKTKPKG